MKTLPKILIFFLVTCPLAFLSCLDDNDYPVEPQIQFINFKTLINEQNITEQGVLTFSFTDGDGDIGLYDSDTTAPYDYNFYITYYEKQKGVLTKVDLPFTLNSRIPILNNNGSNKAIKGEIEDTLFVNNALSQYDTILFEFYIVDRKLHQSNILKTPEIVVIKQK
jgi:hypothetical protein